MAPTRRRLVLGGAFGVLSCLVLLRSLALVTCATATLTVLPSTVSSPLWAAPGTPGWVTTGGRSLRHPNRAFLTGFALAEGTNAVERAKAQAAADLARSITVRIETELDQVSAEKDGSEQYSIAARTRATSEVRLENLGYEVHHSGAKSYALAYIARTDLARSLRGRRDAGAARARAAFEGGQKLEKQTEEGAALRRYYETRAPLAEAMEAATILRATSEVTPADGAVQAELHSLSISVDDRTRALLKRPVSSLSDGVEVLSFQLAQQGLLAPKQLTVEPLTYGTTSFSSAFGRQLSQDLERAVLKQKAAKVTPSQQVVIRGSYNEANGEVRIGLVARDVATGRPTAAADVRVPKKALPPGLALLPQNFEQALVDQHLLASGEQISGDLSVQVWTHKGERNLVFSESDEVRLFLRVNRSAYVRLMYLLVNGQRVLLEQSYFVDASKANHAVEYPDVFEVSPPFGVERIYATAFTERPPPLATKKVLVDGEEYEVLADDLSEVVVRTRGLKKKKKAVNQIAEANLTITTLAR